MDCKGLHPSSSGQGARAAAAPVRRALTLRLAARPLAEAVREVLREPDFADGPWRPRQDGVAGGAAYLVARAVAGLQTAYRVVVVDQDGRVQFDEQLRFFAAKPLVIQAQGLRAVQADPHTAERMAALGALLADRIVCVPDELAAELDALREPLSQALRVQSLAPVLARAARRLDQARVVALLTWLRDGFDAAPGPPDQARFTREARAWALMPGRGLPA